MPPKKQKAKMSLNEFLGDSTLGSWADEMDSLPTAPSGRTDDDRRGGRRDDFMSSRSDRAPLREDLPLPTEPPYTAFVGNLTFDITESELEEFFGGKTKSVKIIKDRDEKPKGFGYVEFHDLDGLKDALAKSNSSLAGRSVRVSVAEPQKERSGFGGGGFDDDKFSNPWRRDGPLPDQGDQGASRDGSRRRYDSTAREPREPPPPSLSDNASDWRSSRPPARATSTLSQESEGSYRKRGPPSREAPPVGPADTEEVWQRGAKLRSAPPPEATERPGSRFGTLRRGDMGPPAPVAAAAPVADEGDWRRPKPISRNSTSPNNSTPPTPQMGRRKLELLPRSSSTSGSPSPLASPNPSTTGPRANPFGAARPVDVSAREAEVEQKIEKEREEVREKVAHTHQPMSRTSSRTGSQRPTPPASIVASPTTPHHEPHKLPPPTVRPSFSFASAAAGKKDASESGSQDDVTAIAEKIDEVELE